MKSTLFRFSETTLSQSLSRNFASMSARAMRRKKLREEKRKVQNVPLLKDTLKKLYLRTHPDLFGKYPEEQQQNETSYKELLGVLDTIKHESPSALTLRLPFYLRTSQEGIFDKVTLNLRTTGGACHTLVEESLGVFFKECGFPSAFRWEEGTWGIATAPPEPVVEPPEVKEESKPEPKNYYSRTSEHVNQKAAPDLSIEKVLDELDDILQLISICPFLPDNDENALKLKEYYMEKSGLDDLENRGFHVRESVKMLWNGEYNIAKLTHGLNADSAQLINRMLMHKISIEKQFFSSEDNKETF